MVGVSGSGRGTRRALLATSAVAAATALIATVTVVVRSDDGSPTAKSSASPTPSPTPSVAPTAVPSPTVTPTASARPTEVAYPALFVAVEQGRLGLYATRTGALVRFLTPAVRGGGASDPSVSPDGTSVVYVHRTAACDAQIREVRIEGGGPTTLVRAVRGRVVSSPDLSRTGRLAYASTTCTGPFFKATDQSTLVVDGRERAFRSGTRATINQLAWTPEGDDVAVLAVLGCPGSPDASGRDSCSYRREIYVVDAAADGPINATSERPVSSPPAPAGRECDWTALTWVGAGPTAGLVNAEVCGDPNVDGSGITRLVSVIAGLPRVIVEGLHDYVDTIDGLSSSSDHLLLGTLSCGETCEDAPTSVHRRAGRRVILVRRRLSQPSWVSS